MPRSPTAPARRNHGATPLNRLQNRLNLPPPTLPDDVLEHLPDIPLRLEVLLPVAKVVDTMDQAPVAQLTQVHTRAAARHGEPPHDVVGAKRDATEVQQCVGWATGA